MSRSLSRRTALRCAGWGAGLLTGLRCAPDAHAGPPVAVPIPTLLAELDELSAALQRAEIDGVDWQLRARALLSGVAPDELRAALELDWASITARTQTAGRAELRLEPGELRGSPSSPRFRRKLFALGPGHAIVPHGHRNLVSAFLVLDGRVRGRHFDRLRDDPEAILIRPTEDRSFAPGDCAAISDRVDNVHWFTSLDAPALLFNVSVTLPPRLHLRGVSTGRVYLDPEGEALEGGLIRAPRSTLSALRAKYDGSGR